MDRRRLMHLIMISTYLIFAEDNAWENTCEDVRVGVADGFPPYPMRYDHPEFAFWSQVYRDMTYEWTDVLIEKFY